MVEMQQNEQFSKPFGKGKAANKPRGGAAKQEESEAAPIKKMPKWK